MANIPGHSGTLGNEMADRKAKEVERMISVGLMSAPSEISLNDARRIRVTLHINLGSENGMKRIQGGKHIIFKHII